MIASVEMILLALLVCLLLALLWGPSLWIAVKRHELSVPTALRRWWYVWPLQVILAVCAVWIEDRVRLLNPGGYILGRRWW